MFCSGVIKHTAAEQSRAKSNSQAEDAVFSFLLCSSASSAIEHTNMCDQVLYQTTAAF
jgi:hypothetical protein